MDINEIIKKLGLKGKKVRDGERELAVEGYIVERRVEESNGINIFEESELTKVECNKTYEVTLEEAERVSKKDGENNYTYTLEVLNVCLKGNKPILVKERRIVEIVTKNGRKVITFTRQFERAEELERKLLKRR